MGFGDQMFPTDQAGIKLACAHNHPEQGQDERCKLCGAQIVRPQQGVTQDGSTQVDDR